MAHNYTTGNQDREIDDASKSDHSSNLIAIIDEMDEKLGDWVSSTGFDDPAACADELDSLRAKVETLETEIKNASS